LPSRHEREEIARVHLKLLKCNEDLADMVAEITDNWTGAEIEQLIKSAARQTNRNFGLEKLEDCKKQIIPISKTAGIQSLREWADKNLRPANDLEEMPAPGSRKMRR
jgi:SpoVK/Ycf46/Vps4 family AAA+-type ATPase